MIDNQYANIKIYRCIDGNLHVAVYAINAESVCLSAMQTLTISLFRSHNSYEKEIPHLWGLEEEEDQAEHVVTNSFLFLKRDDCPI